MVETKPKRARCFFPMADEGPTEPEGGNPTPQPPMPKSHPLLSIPINSGG